MSIELVQDYRDLVKGFGDLAGTISPKMLKISPIEGEWSAAFIIHHLSDAELHFATRYMWILTAENPPIVPFEEEVYPLKLNYLVRDPNLSLKSLLAVSSMVGDILGQVSQVDWQRKCIHSDRGEITLQEVLQTSRNHVKAHIDQLEQVLVKLDPSKAEFI